MFCVSRSADFLFARGELELNVKWTETHFARLYYRNTSYPFIWICVFSILPTLQTGLSRVRISTGTGAGYLFSGFRGPRAYSAKECVCVCVNDNSPLSRIHWAMLHSAPTHAIRVACLTLPFSHFNPRSTKFSQNPPRSRLISREV